MRRDVCTAFYVCWCGLVLASFARADVVLKKDGGKVEGEITRNAPGEEKIEIRTKFGSVVLSRDEVKEIRETPSSKQVYAQKAKPAGANAEDQYALALWCSENDLEEEYTRHLERVIALDPEHAAARKRLGYEKVGDKWVSEDEARSAEGKVKYRGKWMLPQERAQEEAKRGEDARRQELGRLIRTAQRGLRAPDRADRHAEAREELLAIEEPIAVPLLVRMLGKKGTDQERRLLVDVLEGIDGDESTAEIVELALGDPVAPVREAAAVALEPRKSPALVGRLAKELKSNDNPRVCRSAVALGKLGDSSVVPALVDALQTTHKKVIEPTMQDVESALAGQSVRTAETVILPDGTIVRRNPLAGMTADQAFGTKFPQRRVIVEEKQNGEALEALQALTGENFGFSEETWRGWLKSEYRDNAARVKP